MRGLEETELPVGEENRIIIMEDIKYRQIIDEMKSIEEFVGDFGFLMFGRDFILCRKWTFSLAAISTSIEFTVGNIIMCCERACIADANTLLRKYRDDLFFYLYVVVFNSRKYLENSNNITKMEENISRWIQNGLDNLYIQEVLSAIGKSPELKEAVTAFELQKSFSDIGERLNDFVHGNGYEYYNRVVVRYKENECYNYAKRIYDDMKYVTVTFLFLLILCSPHLVMSTDYIDYLDCGEVPPKDVQYLVAPFIERFISDNINLIDEKCYMYLKENTSMNFSSAYYDGNSEDEDISLRSDRDC